MSNEGRVRLPAVAGVFYPSSEEQLFESVHRCFTHDLGPGRFPKVNSRILESNRVECLVVPHAGYQYSGPIAAHSYTIAFDFFHTHIEGSTVIILGPNHFGLGSGLSTSSKEFWRTPFGDANVNLELANELRLKCDIVNVDDTSHIREHSIEVQLPFLQACSGKARWSFVPVSMMLQDHKTSIELGECIAALVGSSSKPFLILASSDLTHYEPNEKAKEKDLALLREVARQNLNAFYTVLERKSITSCGYGAIATVMHAAKRLGKGSATILKYGTSGDVTGDDTSVVGYPSVRFI